MQAPLAHAHRHRAPCFLALAAALLVSLGCAAGNSSVAARADAGASVEALIGDAACDSDAQCRTVAVGAKACGGPQGYRAWSAKRTDGAALQDAAEREARAARAKAESSGVMSNCAMVTDPGAYCAPREASAPSRTCRLRALRAGGPASIY